VTGNNCILHKALAFSACSAHPITPPVTYHKGTTITSVIILHKETLKCFLALWPAYRTRHPGKTHSTA